MKLCKSRPQGRARWHVAAALVVLVIGCMPSGSFELEPPALTPVDQFFVANNNGVPTIPADWRLTIDGEVAAPFELTLESLLNRTATTTMATLVCLGDPFDPRLLAGNADWTGVPLHAVLAEASPLSGARSVIFHCIDGYRVSFSLAEILQREDDLLAYRMNGVTLPLLQGYPLRLVLPGDTGASWVQWLERIEVSAVPPLNSFSPVPLHAQFLNPRGGAVLAAGRHSISGMAVVCDGREISGVDISFDGGATWAPVQLLSTFVPNAWKLWEYTWEASEGEYVISARARDSRGNLQGSEGFFNIAALSISVTVASDSDGDGLIGVRDNCPDRYNPAQEDSYPPQSNGIGDACECEVDFNCDADCDGSDAVLFKSDYGRSALVRPCSDDNACRGDFDCDRDCDGSDASMFKRDFGRSAINNPCTFCVPGAWCNYGLPDNHFVGEPWLNKTSLDFHGASTLSCAACHDPATECTECHFGPSGSKSPPGWTHGSFRHDSVTEQASVCNTCHDLNRTYGNEPPDCHNCHVP